MKKVTALLAALALAGVSYANAGEMAPAATIEVYGSVMDGAYVTNANSMVLSWGGQDISFTDVTPEAELLNPDGTTTTLSGDYTIRLGAPYYYDTSDCLYISLGYLYTAGTYKLSIPAGMVKNEAGDINPAQTFTFYIVESLYSDNFTFAPPLSTSEYDWTTGNNGTAPFYKSSELSNVTIGADGYNFEATGFGTITGYKTYGEDVDFNDVAKFENGLLKLDLSGLEDGTWSITIPSGYMRATTAEGVYVNGGLYLTYIVLDNAEPLTSYTLSNPRQGSYYVDYLNYIELNFGQPIMMADNAPAVTYTYNGETKTVPSAYAQTNYSGEYLFDINLSESRYDYLEEPGLYTINIPAGVVTNGVYANDPITLEFFILNSTNDYTVTPENKSAVSTSDFKEVKITFPGVTSIVANDKNWVDIEVKGGTYGNYIYNYSLNMNNGVAIEGNTITLTLPAVNQVDYWYTIPAKDFILDGVLTNEYINLEYSVWNGLPAAKVLEGPAPDATVSNHVKILLTWDYLNVTATDNFNVVLEENGYYPEELPALSKDAYKLVTIDNPAGGTGTALSIDLTEELQKILSEKEYYNSYFKVVVPAGIVETADGMLNPMQEFPFQAYLLSPEPLVIEEAEGLEGTYYIYMNDQQWMSGLTYDLNLTVTDSKGEVTKLVNDYAYGPDSVEPGTYASTYINTLNLSAIVVNLSNLADGSYTLNVPEGIARFNINSYGGYPDFVNAAASFPITIGDVRGEITIGEVTYTAYPNGQVSFIVPVTSKDLEEGAEITVYYKGPNDTDYQPVSMNHDEYSFDLTGLELDTEYTVSIYAASGSVTSEVVTVTFRTASVVLNPAADLLNVVVENITSSSAELNVAYGFREMPENAKGYIVVTPENGNSVMMEVDTEVYGANVTIELEDLRPATEYSYTVEALIAEADGTMIAMSEPAIVTFTTEASVLQPELNITEALARNIGETVAEIAVTFTAANMPEGAVITAIATQEESRVETVAAVTEDGKATIELNGLTPETTYNYMVVVQANNADGDILTRSNVVYLEFTTLKESDVEGVYTDEDVRYFTLDGVEIANPAAGTLCIKVAGNKAVKVLVK